MKHEFDFIQIYIPKNKLNDDFKELLDNVELIDTIGLPDTALRNNPEQKNEKVIQQNGTFSLDGVFMVTNTLKNRCRVLPSDFIYLKRCNIFKRQPYATNIDFDSLPKIMSLCNYLIIGRDEEEEEFEKIRKLLLILR